MVVVVVEAGAAGSACTLPTEEHVSGVMQEGSAWGCSSLMGTPIDAIWAQSFKLTGLVMCRC